MPSTDTDAGTLSRGLAGGAVVVSLLAAAVLLSPAPLADVFFAGIVLLSPLLAAVGAAGAWTGHTAVVWVAALLSVGLTLVGAMSVGLLFAPAALLLVGSAVAALGAGPDTEAREKLVANPPATRERVQKALFGAAAIVVGAAVVDVAALDRHLFGSCAQETLGCVVETTNWGLVGLTLLGFGAVAVGGWLLWRQVYVTRVLAGARAG